MNWKKFAWLKRGKRRKNVLQVFANVNKPLTINEVKNISKIAISQASATVHELYKLNLLSCKNPDDNIGKLFEIDHEGLELLKYMDDDKNG